MRILLFLLLIGTVLNAEVKVETVNDGVKVGYKVEYSAGDILLYPKPGSDFKHRIGIQSVKSILQSETNSAKFLSAAYLKGKFPAIASEKGDSLFEKNFHTGWGKKSAFYLAMSYVKLQKFNEALKVIKKAKTLIAGEYVREDSLLLEIATKYLEFGKDTKQVKLLSLNNLKVPESPLGKMYYYQLEGMVLEKDNKPSLAVLSYYKGIFLGLKSSEREAVVAKVEGIYKSQGDTRKLPDLNKL